MEQLEHDLSHRFEAESVSRALALVGEKWTMLILREAFFGVRRYGQLVRNLGIPRPTLSARLRTLVDAGLLERVRYATEPPPGPANYMQLLVMRASMTGFVIFDYAKRYREAAAELAGWLQTGELKSREDVVQGDIQQFPEVLLRLFSGENTGKLVLAV